MYTAQEQFLWISTVMLLLIVLVLLTKIANKNHEIKESHQRSEADREKLRRIREETNQYLKEQGYKPKVKVNVAYDHVGTVTGRLSSTSQNTSSRPKTSNNDEHHRRLQTIINLSNID
uniref:Uncharacterized protein n=1 Tax=Bacillus phage Jabberwock TaxID=3163548 RepID=A0AAU8EHC5_9CAUD